MGKWMSASDYRESTKHGHRKALDEVLAFVDNELALPKDVTRETALAYIDSSEGSHTTRSGTASCRSVASGHGCGVGLGSPLIRSSSPTRPRSKGRKKAPRIAPWGLHFLRPNRATTPAAKPHECWGSKTGVADGARTHDNRNHNPGLYQLSYSHRRANDYSGSPAPSRTRAITSRRGSRRWLDRRAAARWP